MSLELLLTWLWNLWCRPRPVPRVTVWFLGVLLVAYCSVIAYLGALHTSLFGHDTFIFLDSGWRVLGGQRPHVDFHMVNGPILSLYWALAIKIGGDNVSLGFGLVRALATAVFTVWGFLLLRNRLKPAATVLLCCLLALLSGAPFSLTSPPFTQSMAMFYNRYGYVLLALVMLESFWPSRWTMSSGFSSGVATALLFFLKINFFGAAAGFLAVSAVASRPRRGRLAGLAAGLLLCGLGLLAWQRFDVAGIAGDLRALAIARSTAFPMKRLLRTVDVSLVPMFVVLSLGLTATALTGKKNLSPWLRVQPLILAGAAIVAELAVGAANQQDAVFIIMSLACVLLLARMAEELGNATAAAPVLGAVLLFGLCPAIPGGLYDLVGSASAVWHAVRQGKDHRSPRIEAPRLSTLIFEGSYADPYKYENGPPLVEVVNDGIRLLREHTLLTDRVLTLGLANPFPIALGRPTPRGGWDFLLLGFTVAEGDFLPAGPVFAEAEAVMVPRFENQAKATTEALLTHYGDVLQREYCLVAQTRYWLLYRKRALPPAGWQVSNGSGLGTATSVEKGLCCAATPPGPDAL